MRKLLIKNFILTRKNDIKLAILNFLCLFIGFLPGMFLGWSILTIPLIIFPISSLFITFAYFRINPAKWEELNDEQKWNYGWAIQNGKSSKISMLTPDQLKEWKILDEKFNKQ